MGVASGYGYIAGREGVWLVGGIYRVWLSESGCG